MEAKSNADVNDLLFLSLLLSLLSKLQGVNHFNVENLKFNSLDNAVKALTVKAKVNTLCARMIFVDYTTGNLILEVNAQYDDEVNNCILGRVDLITGATIISEVPCMIN